MIITNFAAGELSENLKGRVDLNQYYQGAQRIENFEIIPTGGIRRRTGTKRLEELAGNCRIIPFIVNSNTSIVFELHGKTLEEEAAIYYWLNGEKQLDVNGNPINIISYVKDPAHPIKAETDDRIINYSLDEINTIQYAQNYDRIIFTQANHRPLEIVYDVAAGTFRTSLMVLDYYIEPNIDDTYKVVKIVTTSNLPTQAKVGDYCIYQSKLYLCTEIVSGLPKWEEQGNDPSTDVGLFTEPQGTQTEEINEGKYPSCVAFFQNRLYFAGTLRNPQRVWASATPDTSDTRYNKFAPYKKYITVNKVVKDADVHIFTADIKRTNIGSGKTTLTNVSQDLTGALAKAATYYFANNSMYATSVAVNSVTTNSIVLNQELNITWEQGETQKTAVTFTISLWKDPTSPTADDYEYKVNNSNFVTADSSFYLEPASDQNDAIKWLATNNVLSIGTENNVWNIPAGINAQVIQCVMTGRYGSDNIQAHVVDQAVIFFAQGKKGIREFYYNSDNEDFQTNNIALIAEQMLTESAVKDFDFVTNPYNKILVTRDDGQLVQLLYDKNNGVMGWNRLTHGEGKIISTAVTRGNDDADLIYIVVKEGEGLDARYYMELIDPNQEVYLDGWKIYTDEADKEGYNDNAVIYNATTKQQLLITEEIPEGFIGEDDVVYIGYVYESILCSMPCMAGGPTDKKRIVNLYVRFNDSYLPVMQVTDMPDEYFTTIEEPYSGIARIDYPGTSERDVVFTLSFNKPERCKILFVEASLA